MNSLLKAFKEFYNEINGATLTGAIDVIVVEQADGSFVCSPFHVRFGKLGVLRSREKVVDIEVNGEPVDIHMKLGESGEAFFVQECPENDLKELPANLATSPLPTEEFSSNYEEGNQNDNDVELKIRRNSTVTVQTLQNIKDNRKTDEIRHRRYSEKVLEPHESNQNKRELTTEQIRQELTAREVLTESETKGNSDNKDDSPSAVLNDIQSSKDDVKETKEEGEVVVEKEVNPVNSNDNLKQIKCDDNTNRNKHNKNTNLLRDSNRRTNTKELSKADRAQNEIEKETNNLKEPESKSKKKRRRKSLMKKRVAIAVSSSMAPAVSTPNRKGSISSSGGSGSAGPSDANDIDTDSNQQSSNATSASIDDLAKSELAVSPNISLNEHADSHENLGTPHIYDLHFFSDTEAANSPYGSRPSTPIQSDSEFEISQRDNLVKNEKNSDKMSTSTASWKWGELPTTPAKPDADAPMNKDAKQAERNSTLSTMLSFMKESIKMRKGASEGVYLSDLIDTEGVDPEVVAKYFPQKNQSFQNLPDADDRESGNGTSLPQSPSSVEDSVSKCLEFDFDNDAKGFDRNVIALSLCGGLHDNGPIDEEFEKHLIEYDQVCQSPAIFSSPALVVRLCGKYYSWADACPIVMTALAYRKPLTNEAIDQLMNVNKTSSTSSTLNINKPKLMGGVSEQIEKDQNDKHRNGAGYSWWHWRRSNDNADKKTPSNSPDKNDTDRNVQSILEEKTESMDASMSMVTCENSKLESSRENSLESDALEHKNDDSISSELADINRIGANNEKFRKSLRLTSEQIESLNLKPGMNEVEFSVTTAYQGTTRCKCYIFLWKYTDKVVISDIDGTITKSDVLGHILPMVGKDWAQMGVAELFTKIAQNGYKLLYLSARAIGQSRATRDYLRSIQQGDVKLPDGPLLLNPTSLISAFHREVIERKPEQFKIACLSDIKALFPQNPFYAGYGNRINDVWAYRAVGIPIIRIFTINPKGELKHELNKTFQSSYRCMAYIVDQLFPPINDKEGLVEFSSFNFWREPVLEMDCEHLLDQSVNIVPAATDQLPRICHIPATPTMETDLLKTIPENTKA